MTRHEDPTAVEDQPQTAEELTAEIEATRERLGATVDELSQRLDVKRQVGAKVNVAKAKGRAHVHTVKQKAQSRPVQLTAAGVTAAVGAGVATVVYRRKH
jgi:ribosome-binding protein aMBF1 (putative translation factor)